MRKNNTLLQKIIKTVETSVGPRTKALVFTLLVATGATTFALWPTQDMTSPTVMVASLYGGGGSGVIIETSESKSLVLTNQHVCELLEFGGIVKTSTGKTHTVSRYIESLDHDLCIAEVNADLGVAATISDTAPALYEEASVSGHPNLLPTVVSSGHFSGTRIISVLTGFKKCTEDDIKNGSPEEKFFCAFFGMMPIIKTYETVLVTATIMPGSSGSAVYNSKGEVSSLVFAGSRGLSYAFTVPYGFVKNFVDNTRNMKYLQRVYKEKRPNYEASLGAVLQQRKITREKVKEIIQFCVELSLGEKEANIPVERICNILQRDLKWRHHEKLNQSMFFGLTTDSTSIVSPE